MRFGVRECANIVFRAKQETKIGNKVFHAGQPVLYIDTATTSSLEQSATTTYAQGGRGNTRLIAWEGDKTLSYTVTDALLSPIGFHVLSGAGLFKQGDGNQGSETGDLVHFHMTTNAAMNAAGEIDLTDAISQFGGSAKICVDDAPIYIMGIEADGSISGDLFSGTVTVDNGKITLGGYTGEAVNVMVDYYVDLPGASVWEADITPDTFAGYYYVEADTLFRRQHDGVDLPANLTFPNVKLQSNFTIAMAGTGDPSTFDFVMDAFPGYTYFDKTKKVLCVLQIVDDATMAAKEGKPVMPHNETKEDEDVLNNDSHDGNNTSGAGPAPGPGNVGVTGINLTSPANVVLDSGISETAQITYEVLPADATNKAVTFTSDDDTIASVSDTGLITAVAAGNATITITTVDGGFSAAVDVDVS